MTSEDSTYDRGMKVRREVLGDEHVDRTIGARRSSPRTSRTS